ncbi:MAG: hypothetical protein R2788_15415 [Saprospiraceae bacterium]
MVATKKSISPQAFLAELKKIRIDIKPEELTTEGREELINELNKMEALVLQLKKELLENKDS